MENAKQVQKSEAQSLADRVAANAIYRVELMELCEQFRHTLSLVASVDELAGHLGKEWFVVHELVNMATSALYLARRTIDAEMPFDPPQSS